MTRQTLYYSTHPVSRLIHLSWLEVVTLLLLVALALRAPSFGVTGLDWDESLYVVMAQRWLQGGLPYVAVWDQHPVGLPALLAASTWLIGDGLLATRIACLLAVTGTAALLYGFLARRAAAPLAGPFAALFYMFYMSRPDGLAANTEVFNNLVVSAASFLLLGQFIAGSRRVRASAMFVSSLLLGIGLQFKYVVMPEAVLLCCAVLYKMLRDGERLVRTLSLAVLAMVGGLLPTALATLYFWHAGVLPAYLDANWRANVAYLDSPLTLATILARLRFGLLTYSIMILWSTLMPMRHRRRASCSGSNCPSSARAQGLDRPGRSPASWQQRRIGSSLQNRLLTNSRRRSGTSWIPRSARTGWQRCIANLITSSRQLPYECMKALTFIRGDRRRMARDDGRTISRNGRAHSIGTRRRSRRRTDARAPIEGPWSQPFPSGLVRGSGEPARAYAGRRPLGSGLVGGVPQKCQSAPEGCGSSL
jgi:hypothetical protein